MSADLKRDTLAEAHFKKVNPLLVDQLEYFKEHGHSKTIEAFKAGYDARDEEVKRIITRLVRLKHECVLAPEDGITPLQMADRITAIISEHESGGAG